MVSMYLCTVYRTGSLSPLAAHHMLCYCFIMCVVSLIKYFVIGTILGMIMF
jgi:hypothetical protein